MSNTISSYTSAKVVVVVPTYNRPHFLQNALRCFAHQDYPADNLSMIILDDSSSPLPVVAALEAFYSSLPTDQESSPHLSSRIQVIYDPRKMDIGEKRNRLNQLALSRGAEYIACMDDDDYYFPDRISYSVRQLQKNHPEYLIAGCNSALVYFPLQWQKEMMDGNWKQLANKDSTRKVFLKETLFRSPTVGTQVYSTGHICNASMMYHRNYLLTHEYKKDTKFGEERHFLNDFQEKVLHLPSERVFVCIAHGSNTVEKYSMVRQFHFTQLQASGVIENQDCLKFYRGGASHPQVLSAAQYQEATTTVIDYQPPVQFPRSSSLSDSLSLPIFRSVFPSLWTTSPQDPSSSPSSSSSSSSSSPESPPSQSHPGQRSLKRPWLVI